MTEFPKTDDLDEQLEFIDKIKIQHKQLFGKELNVQDKVDYLTTSSFENVKKSTKGVKNVSINFKNNQPIKSTSNVNKTVKSIDVVVDSDENNSNRNDYSYEMKSNNVENKSEFSQKSDKVGNMKFTLGMIDDEHEFDVEPHDVAQFNHGHHHNDNHHARSVSQHKPTVPIHRKIISINSTKVQQFELENKLLKNEISELSILKEDLEDKIEQSFSIHQKSNSNIMSTNIRTDPKVFELMEIKKKREQEIDEMKRKIQKLENTAQEDPVYESRRTEQDFQVSNRSNRTKSQLFDDKTTSSKILRPPKTYNKVVEKSGSSFVDQMRNDIGKLLNRGGGGGNTNNPDLKRSEMVRSYYPTNFE